MDWYRNMIRVLVVTAVLCSSAAASDEATVSLEPAREQDRTALPYRLAELTVRNAGGETASVIRAVQIRESQGGPTFVVAVTVPPDSTRTVRVKLPAVSLQQTYRVRLLTEMRADSPAVSEFELPLTWDVELVNTEEWIDAEAYAPWEGDLPSWSPTVKRNVFLTAVLISLAMAAALFVPPTWRTAALILVAAAGCYAATLPLRSVDVVVERRLTLPHPRQRQQDQTLWALTSRRTTPWTREGIELTPIYRHRGEMLSDDTVIGPGDRIRLSLRPADLRLLRQAK